MLLCSWRTGSSDADQRPSEAVQPELRRLPAYFGALTVDEIAIVARISPATVKRELATAKVWLRHRMGAA